MDKEIMNMFKVIRDSKYGSLNESNIVDKRISLNEFKDTSEAPDTNDSPDDPNLISDAIPYTQNDDIYNHSLETTKNDFQAKYFTSNPLLYKKDGNGNNEGIVTLSGTIPGLNQAKFEFIYQGGDATGCYIWLDGKIKISKETNDLLFKFYGSYDNWVKYLQNVQDLRPISMERNDK